MGPWQWAFSALIPAEVDQCTSTTHVRLNPNQLTLFHIISFTGDDAEEELRNLQKWVSVVDRVQSLQSSICCFFPHLVLYFLYFLWFFSFFNFPFPDLVSPPNHLFKLFLDLNSFALLFISASSKKSGDVTQLQIGVKVNCLKLYVFDSDSYWWLCFIICPFDYWFDITEKGYANAQLLVPYVLTVQASCLRRSGSQRR